MGKRPTELKRKDWKDYAHHAANLGLRPRTEVNYLSNLNTFLRHTGRVVIVARNEQEAILTKASAIIPNTLV